MYRGVLVVQLVKCLTPALGHDLVVHEFKPCIRLCANGSEPGAHFRFYVFLSLCPSPAHTLSLSLSQK